MYTDYRQQMPSMQQMPGMQQVPMGMQGYPPMGMPMGQPMEMQPSEMQQPTGFQPQMAEQQGAPSFFPGGGQSGAGAGFERRLERLERQVERLDRQINRFDRRISRIERQLGFGRPEDLEVQNYSGGYY